MNNGKHIKFMLALLVFLVASFDCCAMRSVILHGTIDPHSEKARGMRKYTFSTIAQAFSCVLCLASADFGRELKCELCAKNCMICGGLCCCLSVTSALLICNECRKLGKA